MQAHPPTKRAGTKGYFITSGTWFRRLRTLASGKERFDTFTHRQVELLSSLLDDKCEAVWKATPYYKALNESASDEQVVQLAKAGLLHILSAVWETNLKAWPKDKMAKLSQRERTALGSVDPNLRYTETSLRSLGEVLWNLSPPLKSGGIFYDLGSGAGKLAIAAALLHDFDRIVGIEVLGSLATEAERALDTYDDYFKDDYNVKTRHEHEVFFKRGCFENADWKHGDVVFCNTANMDAKLVKALSQRAESLRPGALVITTSTSLPSKQFHKIYARQHVAGEGLVTFVVHQKRSGVQSAS